MDLNSVERVVEYLDLPQEPPAIIESNRVPAYWPSSNSTDLVVVQDLVIKYAPDLPAVLHGISFALKPRERVGLLGRTGSGKSTLAMALLRFVDPTEGKIVIDGMDISTIGLKDLRSRVVRVVFMPFDLRSQLTWAWAASDRLSYLKTPFSFPEQSGELTQCLLQRVIADPQSLQGELGSIQRTL